MEKFTFHYGSILITRPKYIEPLREAFTFHYGSILIQKKNLSEKLPQIYIPLWFYSNLIVTFCQEVHFLIYIPLWFYSNVLFCHSKYPCKNIYIPLWFYSNPTGPLIYSYFIILPVPKKGLANLR